MLDRIDDVCDKNDFSLGLSVSTTSSKSIFDNWKPFKYRDKIYDDNDLKKLRKLNVVLVREKYYIIKQNEAIELAKMDSITLNKKIEELKNVKPSIRYIKKSNDDCTIIKNNLKVIKGLKYEDL